MNFLDLLPEKWGKVAYMRYVKLRNETIQSLAEQKQMEDVCLGCPFLRTYMDMDWVYAYCTADKCIKQYPHKRDHKEFK